MESRKHPTVLIGDRQTGKSTALLRMALKEHGNIAVFNSHACEVFKVIAEEVLRIPVEKIRYVEARWVMIEDVLVAPIYAYTERPRGSYMNPARPLFIDELEMSLRGLFYRSPRIGGFTMSIEQELEPTKTLERTDIWI